MKKNLIIVLTLFSSNLFAGYEAGDGWGFYNLFKQTNISAEEYYPFLRVKDECFYSNRLFINTSERYPKGNITLWREILQTWSVDEIERAIYDPQNFSWQNKNSGIDKKAKAYIDFAQTCSEVFNYRKNLYSWDYNKIKSKETINPEELLSEANRLLNNEADEQLKARYYYQIIRILHYTQNWDYAIKLYESKIKNQFPKNEIYYYIVDQVAGSYYSVKRFNEAAYLFSKVFSESIDRKKSAFTSYNFCTSKNADGKPFINGVEDQKNLLVLTSLRNFSDEIHNLNKFIQLDNNDPRLELLFMRAINNIERIIWRKRIGFGDRSLPSIGRERNYQQLLSIAEKQAASYLVENKDFWKLSSSYLSFINNDIKTAKIKLSEVNSFPNQKRELSFIYEVFSWEQILSSNEVYLNEILKTIPEKISGFDDENDLRNFILDKVANTYYKNNQIGKAFLVQNKLEQLNNINSLELLDALEKFYYQPNKNSYEQSLISQDGEKHDFMDYVNYQKGIYFLYDNKPDLALEYFEKNKSYKAKKQIPNTIFSNNIKECFSCSASEVMDDEVYKADVFSFIDERFSRRQLANNLKELEKLTSDEKPWKAKLANYLLANYYYNISNTGYYRGLLTDNTNSGDGIYINYAQNPYGRIKTTAEELIAKRTGYNMSNIRYYEYEKHYFDMSGLALKYYQNVIDLSTDKELNARCAYLMAKCELNDFYNNGGYETFEVSLNNKWNETIELPALSSFRLLKQKYADTDFQRMIINECSYYRYYSNNN